MGTPTIIKFTFDGTEVRNTFPTNSKKMEHCMNIPSLGRYDTEQWRATTVTCLKAYIISLNTLLEKLETHLITRIYLTKMMSQ